jgi:hypothetical protein
MPKNGKKPALMPSEAWNRGKIPASIGPVTQVTSEIRQVGKCCGTVEFDPQDHPQHPSDLSLKVVLSRLSEPSQANLERSYRCSRTTFINR